MDIILVCGLIVLNGLFAMAEIAMVSSRKTRLQKWADKGSNRARAALKLCTDPSTFLATVQVGITAVGILSGAIGEAVFTAPLTAFLMKYEWIAPYAKPVAVTAVVVLLTYFAIVVGELVPKQLALRAPERVAVLFARPMTLLARAARPLVWLLSSSSRLLLALAGAPGKSEPPVTNEEINVLMEQGAEAGVFHESEQEIVSNVLRLDEQRIGLIMTHRNDIYMLDLDSSEAEIRDCLSQCPHSRVVVCRGDLDHVVGILRLSDVFKAALNQEPLDVVKHLHDPLYVPESVTTTKLLESLRLYHHQCALVVDEYGSVCGIATLFDVLTSIVGELSDLDPQEDMGIVVRDDQSLLVDGDVSVERIRHAMKLAGPLHGEEDNAFNTIGGFIMYTLGRVPVTADHFIWSEWRFEVMDMDNNRVDKVLIARIVSDEAVETASGE